MKQSPISAFVVRTTILALLLPAGLLVAQNQDSEMISELMSRVKSHAAAANSDIARLESYTRHSVSAESQAEQLNQMKVHVNNLLRDADKMKSMRTEGSAWQQQAIDRVEPLLPLIAAHLTATINHLNDNRKGLKMKPYRDLVLANQRLIADANKLISDYVEFSEAKARADALEKKLM